MSAPPSERSDATRRRRLLRAIGIGCLLLVPRIALAWLVLPSAYDLTQIVVTLVFVGGLFAIGVSLVRLRALRNRSLLPVAIGGLAAIVVAGLVLRVVPPSGEAVAYTGGLLAPAPVALAQWLYLAIGGLSQLGLVLLIGSVGAALSRRFAPR